MVCFCKDYYEKLMKREGLDVHILWRKCNEFNAKHLFYVHYLNRKKSPKCPKNKAVSGEPPLKANNFLQRSMTLESNRKRKKNRGITTLRKMASIITSYSTYKTRNVFRRQ